MIATRCFSWKLLTPVLLLFFSCKQKVEPPPLFNLMDQTGIHFTNNIKNTNDFNIFMYRNFYNGGGVAIGDINNDGLSDVFFTANMGSNKLYLNKGAWQFEDVSQKAGITESEKWSTGVVMVDVNNDGWLDIYVCNAGFQKGVGQENALFINNKDLTFTEAAKEYGLADPGYTTHAAFFDYDGDGDLDVYLLNNSFIPVNTLNYANKRDLRAEDWPVADFLKGGGDRLLKNNGGKFTDVSKEAGIYGSLIGFGLGVTVGDVNGDYYPDIYVSNDFFERDYLYINQKNGTYKEDLENWMQHISHSSMGADIADINNDGYADIFTTDMLPGDDYRLKTTTSFENIDVNRLKVASGFYHQYMQNTLQVNNKQNQFLETGFYSGVAATDWSWGGLIFDADNDGLSDIFVCNGIYNDVTDQDFIDFFANDVIQNMVMTGRKEQIDEIIKKMPSKPIPNKAFKNKGNLKFSDEGANWGFTEPSFSNGAAYGDLDNDGDLDLVINNVNGPSFVYRNNSREQAGNHFIGVSLKGTKNNPFAIGSVLKIYRGAEVLTREVVPSRGFQSSVDYKAIVGLGKNDKVDSMVVVWPDRSYTTYVQPAINKVHVLQQTENKKWITDLKHPAVTPLLDSVTTNAFEKHTEDDYVDFYYERNIPVMLSREGPKAAKGDVNGDGLEDIYITGAAGQSGQLYLQTPKGFVPKKMAAFEYHAANEDVAALFFDCDGDKDLDLFVGTGGNHFPAYSLDFQDRLYKNDGKGAFTLDGGALPRSGMNTALAIAHDVDSDGDQDLFVGSRSVPQNYGVAPQSQLLLNDGSGRFTDVTKERAKELMQLGMVTGAVWADATGDGKKELMVVGEWMAPRIFSYTNSGLTEIKTTLNNLLGWWLSMAAEDLDGDGDKDLVLGNNGENFYLQPSAENPVKLWINDFDNNQTMDKIMTRTVDGKDVPVFLKKELTDQVASLRKQNYKYADFATKSIQQLFPSDVMRKTTVRSFNYPSSCIAWNEGNGKFTIQKLPVPVQLSSVNAIQCTDVNGDGAADLVMGGNRFGFLPQFSRLDASYGHVLLNRGKRQFTPMETAQSGLVLRGEIRDIQVIGSKQAPYLLFLQNNQTPALYQLHQKERSK